MSEYKKKFVLDEERIPKAWYCLLYTSDAADE